MKKLLLWFLTLALLLSMAACGETETDTQSNDDTEKTESNAENGNNTQSTPDGESTPGSESGDAGNTGANDGLEGTMTITIDQVNSTSITLPQA